MGWGKGGGGEATYAIVRSLESGEDTNVNTAISQVKPAPGTGVSLGSGFRSLSNVTNHSQSRGLQLEPLKLSPPVSS